MKYLRQLLIILIFSFAGEVLHYLVPIQIPASIYGIILLFTGLMTGIVPPESVRDTGMFLVEIMPVMFIPAAVGLIESRDILSDKLFSYLLVTFLTTIVVMAVTGVVTQKVIRGRKEQSDDR